MAKIKVLLVEDEQTLAMIIKDTLEENDFIIHTANDGEEGLSLFFELHPDVLVADVMMPKMDGWQVCREIRQYSKVPIIMLTARGAENDELRGFELGVDEYISKPFSPKILVARVQAILRRANAASEDVLEYGGIELNRSAHEVVIDGEKIDLSFKELELLAYFMENKDIALSRERI